MVALLIYLLVILLAAFVAHHIITKFFPAEMQTIALAVVGIILLIVVLSFLAGRFDFPALR
jgi:hypothetical protein